MCNQTWIAYTCGCKTKGAFEQCDRLYDLQSPLRCAIADRKELAKRNYCSEHMPQEDKATITFRERKVESRKFCPYCSSKRQCWPLARL
jgi:hypothetical protein